MDPVSFAQYTLLKRLAWGGMAELYLAEPLRPRRPGELVVLKVIARRYAEDPAFVAMFGDEARIAALLEHRNIGRVLEVGEADGTHFLVMEHLHGKDLRAICRRSLDQRRRPVPVEIAVPIGVALCDALRHAHDATAADGTPLRIIHRDVSPSNVMVTYDGDVKLVDFGIAKAANRSTFTQPGMIKGKLRYLSPEQVLGVDVDRRCDLFILGATLWEATLGRHLFEGQDEARIYQAISEGRIPRPTSIAGDYPPALEAILMRALAHNREARPRDAAELRAELVGFARGAGIPLYDPAPLAEYLRALFADEYSAWQRAQRAGASLRDHLTAEEAPAPGEGARQPAAPAEPTPRRTLFFGERVERAVEPTARPQADAAGRITLRSATGRGAAAPTARDDEPRVWVSDDAATGVTGHVVGDARAGVEPAGSARPTVIDPDQLATNPRLDPGAGRALELQRTTESAVGPPATATPAPPPSAGLHRDASDLSGARTSAAGADLGLPSPASLPGSGVRPLPQPDRRTRTGDWAQRMLEGKHGERPGTHPYFDDHRPEARGDAAAPAPATTTAPPTAPAASAPASAADELDDVLPHRLGGPKVLAAIAGAVLLLLLGLAAWLLLRDAEQPAAPPPAAAAAVAPVAAADAAPDAAPDAAVPDATAAGTTPPAATEAAPDAAGPTPTDRRSPATERARPRRRAPRPRPAPRSKKKKKKKHPEILDPFAK